MTYKTIVDSLIEHVCSSKIHNDRIYAVANKTNKEFSEVLADYINFFLSNILEKKAFYANKVVEGLLSIHDTEEYNEFRKLLMFNEMNKKLHRKYRDHSIHTLFVYFLGIFLFEKFPDFFEWYKQFLVNEQNLGFPKIKMEPDEISKDFAFRWTYISLFHDIGWVMTDIDSDIHLADDKEEKCPGVKTLIDLMGDFFEYYPKYYLPQEFRDVYRSKIREFTRFLKIEFIKPEDNSSDDDKIFNIYQWLTIADQLPAVQPYDQEYNNMFILESDIFSVLSRYGGYFVPGFTREDISLYFEKLFKSGIESSGFKKRIFDHGIVSACLYLKFTSFAYWFVYQVRNIKLTDQHDAFADLIEMVNKSLIDQPIRYPEFVHLKIISEAWAMLIHEVSYKDYNRCIPEMDKEPMQKIFPLGPTGHFLAFFLSFCDLLQDWDRQKYRDLDPSAPLKSSLQSYEFGIEFDEENIILTILKNRLTESRIENLKKELKKFDSNFNNRIIIKEINESEAFLEIKKRKERQEAKDDCSNDIAYWAAE